MGGGLSASAVTGYGVREHAQPGVAECTSVGDVASLWLTRSGQAPLPTGPSFSKNPLAGPESTAASLMVFSTLPDYLNAIQEDTTNKKIALVTNVLDFVGPPAVKALLEDGYHVVAQDPAFQDPAKQED